MVENQVFIDITFKPCGRDDLTGIQVFQSDGAYGSRGEKAQVDPHSGPVDLLNTIALQPSAWWGKPRRPGGRYIQFDPGTEQCRLLFMGFIPDGLLQIADASNGVLPSV